MEVSFKDMDYTVFISEKEVVELREGPLKGELYNGEPPYEEIGEVVLKIIEKERANAWGCFYESGDPVKFAIKSELYRTLVDRGAVHGIRYDTFNQMDILNIDGSKDARERYKEFKFNIEELHKLFISGKLMY